MKVRQAREDEGVTCKNEGAVREDEGVTWEDKRMLLSLGSKGKHRVEKGRWKGGLKRGKRCIGGQMQGRRGKMKGMDWKIHRIGGKKA